MSRGTQKHTSICVTMMVVLHSILVEHEKALRRAKLFPVVRMNLKKSGEEKT